MQFNEFSNLIGKKSAITFILSDMLFIKENEFHLYDGVDENRFSSPSRIFWNTGPIPIIFGSLESKKIELSFFWGIAMLPLTSIFAVLVTIHGTSKNNKI